MNMRFLGRPGQALFGTAMLLVLVAAGCGGQRSEQLREQGDTLLAINNLDEAENNYQAALEVNPDNARAHLGLSRVNLARGHENEAIEGLRRAVELDAGLAEATEELARLLAQRGEYDEAMALARELERRAPDQGSALTAALEEERNGGARPAGRAATAPAGTAEAPPWRDLWRQASLEEMLSYREQYRASGDSAAQEALVAAALFTLNRPLADELLGQLPASSPLHACVEALEQNDPEALRAAMEAWEEPEESLRQNLRSNVTAFALAQMGLRARALQLFSLASARWPDETVSLYNVARVFQAARMPEFEERALLRLHDAAPDNVEARNMLFQAQRANGKWEAARATAEATYAAFPNHKTAILNLAQAFIDTHEFDVAENVLGRGRAAMADDPLFAVLLAVTKLRAGRPAEALEILDAANISPENRRQAQSIAVFSAASLGNWAEVLERTGAIDLAEYGPEIRLLRLAALAHAGRTGDMTGAIAAPDGSRAVPGSAGAVLWTVAGGAASDELSGPAAELADSLRASPDATANFAYAAAAHSGQLRETAFAAYEKVLDAVGSNALLVRLMFEALTTPLPTPGMVERAEALAQRHADMADAWLGLATVKQALNDAAGERQALERAALLVPRNPEMLFRRAQFLERQDELDAAREMYRQYLELRPDDPVAHNNYAYCLLVTGGSLDEALQHAERAVEQLPGSPHVRHTLGTAQLRRGDLEDGARNLIIALELRPGDPTLLLDYGQLLIAQGEEEEGRRNIQLALQYSNLLGLEFPRRAEAEQLVAVPG